LALELLCYYKRGCACPSSGWNGKSGLGPASLWPLAFLINPSSWVVLRTAFPARAEAPYCRILTADRLADDREQVARFEQKLQTKLFEIRGAPAF
jgi:hypothetical protein